MSEFHTLEHWHIYESMPVPCLIVTPALTVAAVNKAYLAQAGLKKKDILDHSFFEVIQADTATEQLLRSSFSKVLKTKKAHELQKVSYKTATAGAAETRSWDIKNVPGPAAGKDPAYIVHFATGGHCTEKNDFQTLLSIEKKYQQLFENNPMPMWVIKQDDFSFMAVNNMAIIQYGYSREEFLSMTALDIRPDTEKDLFIKSDHSYDTTAENFNRGSWKHKKKDGTIINVQIMVHDIIFEDTPAKMVLANDITDKLKAEEKVAVSEKQLRKSQESYRIIMERISDAFVAFDTSWRYEYVNKAAGIILGRSPESLIGKNVWEEFPESVGYRLYDAFHEALQSQQHIQLEEYYAPFDMWMEFNIYPSPEGVSVFFGNINKRKQAELKLVESEGNLKAIFDNTSEGFILTDVTGVIKVFNERVIEIALQNVSDRMRTGINIFQLTESERLEFFRHVFNQVLQGETVQYDRQYNTADGRIIWVNLSFNPVKEEDKVTGVCITARDITERKRAEEQLQKSYFEKRALAEKLSAILNTLPANIALVDVSGRIIEVNDSWRNFAIQNDFQGEHYGLGENYITVAEKATGAGREDGLSVARGLSSVLQEKLHEFVYEYPGDSPSVTRWFRMVATPLHKKEYAGAVIMHLDISEVRRLEAERMQLRLEEQKKITLAILQGQEKERNHIGREMHDNINQILAGVRMYLSIAGSNDEQIKEAIRYPMELLDQSIEEIRKLCSSMVTPLQDVQLEELISELLKKLDKNHIETTFDFNIPGDPISDELKLNIYRIIQELSNNVVKYAKASLVTVRLWLENDRLQLLVTDNGKGFDTSSKRDGIGISNMRSRVQSFNGEINIESSKGKGTKTMVSIPYR